MDVFQDTLTVGDIVTWRDDGWATMTDGRHRFGDILTIIEVRPVAPKDFSVVAHTQHVRIDKSNDWFSGAFFRKKDK